MKNGLISRIKEGVYGKNQFNLHIASVGMYNLPYDAMMKVNDKLSLCTGKFIITDKGYLMRGEDKNLNYKFARLDFDELGNTEAMLDGNGDETPHIHYSLTGEIDYIVRDMIGIRLESFIPLIRRFKLKKRGNFSEIVPSFGF